jgi:transcriptional regulator with XRE-family HTH domain
VGRTLGSTRAVYTLDPRKVWELRLDAGRTQADLATAAGLSRATISLVERGRVAVSPGAARRLASALGVTPDELAAGSRPVGDPPTPSRQPTDNRLDPAAREAEDFIRSIDQLGDAAEFDSDRILYVEVQCPDETPLLHAVTRIVASVELNIRSFDAPVRQSASGNEQFHVLCLVNPIAPGSASRLRRALQQFLGRHKGTLKSIGEIAPESLIVGDQPPTHDDQIRIWIRQPAWPEPVELPAGKKYGVVIEPDSDPAITSLSVRGTVAAHDRIGLLRDVTEVLATEDVRLSRLTGWTDADGAYVVRFEARALKPAIRDQIKTRLEDLAEGVERQALAAEAETKPAGRTTRGKTA